MSLAQAIKTEAHRLGFALVGFTSHDPPPHWPVFESWLAKRRNGTMAYLKDHRRADPKLVFPECQTVLVLALRYPSPGLAKPNEPSYRSSEKRDRGVVSAYAWGWDYHIIFPERIKALVGYIETRIGCALPHRWYTDTGPLLERDLAQRAGLGWIGKNTCLINPKIGSYFFLAEILLGIEIETDAAFTADRCGTCTRCIDACPTGCILSDRTIDARFCISYLTIENKNEISLELRREMGNRVFGCDICQQVCPWNRFADDNYDPAFDARAGIPYPILKEELRLSPQQFNLKFKQNPVLRSKRRGYLRNIAVALGNSDDLSALPVLEKASQNDDPLIREHALWAIEKLKQKETQLK